MGKHRSRSRGTSWEFSALTQARHDGPGGMDQEGWTKQGGVDAVRRDPVQAAF